MPSFRLFCRRYYSGIVEEWLALLPHCNRVQSLARAGYKKEKPKTFIFIHWPEIRLKERDEKSNIIVLNGFELDTCVGGTLFCMCQTFQKWSKKVPVTKSPVSMEPFREEVQ